MCGGRGGGGGGRVGERRVRPQFRVFFLFSRPCVCFSPISEIFRGGLCASSCDPPSAGQGFTKCPENFKFVCEDIFNIANAQKPPHSTKNIGNWKEKKREGEEKKTRNFGGPAEGGLRDGVPGLGVWGRVQACGPGSGFGGHFGKPVGRTICPNLVVAQHGHLFKITNCVVPEDPTP